MSTGGESSVQENKVNPIYQKSFWMSYGYLTLQSCCEKSMERMYENHLRLCLVHSKRWLVNVYWSLNSLNFLYFSHVNDHNHYLLSLGFILIIFPFLLALILIPRVATHEDKKLGIEKVQVC